MFPESKESLQLLLYIYAGLFFTLLLATWSSKRTGAGLPLCYAFALSLIHVPGALAYAMPNYKPTLQVLLDNQASLKATQLGFEMTTLALFGLLVGFLVTNFSAKQKSHPNVASVMPAIGVKLPGTLMIMSLLFFFVLTPIMRLIPSMGSIAAAGVALSVVAVCSACWEAWKKGETRRFYTWLIGSSFGFPFVSLILMGFMSVGTASVILVWMFVLTFYRPRWLAFVLLIVLGYGGLTIYVNYIRERNAIRQSVWGEQQLSSRLDRIADVVVYFHPFDPWNRYHLEALDVRLNQNHLVGLSVDYIRRGKVDFAKGYTLWVAAVAWVPRILWPGKPSTAGSGGMVAHFTGLVFPKNTSVGIGQVMEFYINFGSWCVFIGFVTMGGLLRWFDLRAGEYLVIGDYWNFGRWFLPATGLLNVAGNTATMVASVAAAVVFTTGLHRVFFAQYYEWSQSMVRQPTRHQALPVRTRPQGRVH